MTHPARFSVQVLEVVRPIIANLGLPVHDPFAGTGERLGKLCDSLGLEFSGTEIEPEFIVDQRVNWGDSTKSRGYPCNKYIITTSPSYPNGISDHFHARDGSKRHTYRQALAEIIGHDRPLHLNNMGRYGNRYRRSWTSENTHFEIARKCVQHWPAHVIVNVKNVIASNYSVNVVGLWKDLLEDYSYIIEQEIAVQTPGQRQGANGELRADHEVVLAALRE